MKDKIFLTHQLLQPLNDLKQVEMNVLQFKTYEPIHVKYSENNDEYVDQLIHATTGLSIDDIQKLSTPDFNTLEIAINDQINRDSKFYFTQDGKEIMSGQHCFNIYDDFIAFDSVQMKLPTVKASRVMHEIKGTKDKPYKPQIYILQACSDLDEYDIYNLSIRDWNTLQKAVNDFLSQDAAFFAESL